MSTTFEVYPHSKALPQFGQLLATAEPRLHAYFERYQLGACPKLLFEVRAWKSHEVQAFTPASPVSWSEEDYAWFYLDGVIGGTDVSVYSVDEHYSRESWDEEIRTRERSRTMSSYISECLSTGHYWSFCQSGGQPAVVNVAYGFVAAALAELTEGIIYSSDCAWDYECFPCRAQEFYEFYFRPECALTAMSKELAEECIQRIRENGVSE
jgi:hypothetical protein